MTDSMNKHPAMPDLAHALYELANIIGGHPSLAWDDLKEQDPEIAASYETDAIHIMTTLRRKGWMMAPASLATPPVHITYKEWMERRQGMQANNALSSGEAKSKDEGDGEREEAVSAQPPHNAAKDRALVMNLIAALKALNLDPKSIIGAQGNDAVILIPTDGFIKAMNSIRAAESLMKETTEEQETPK